MSKITSRDIAKLAGVSPSAVSVAINGKPGISEETRARILDIARQFNYCTGTTSAKVLRERSVYITALFRADTDLINQAFFFELSMVAVRICKEQEYSLVSSYITGNDSALELPPSIRFGEVNGVLVFGDQNPSLYTELNRLGIPFVIIDSCNIDSQYPSVFVNYCEAAYLATKYLIELGHRDIAFMCDAAPREFSVQVLNGFQRATMEADISLYPNRFQLNCGTALRESLEHALAGPHRPTAIFCFEDLTALRIIRELISMGIRVPEDISVIGIDGINYGKIFTPSLTTMRVDQNGMVNRALEMLTALMNGESCQSQFLPIPTLTVGESTAPLKLS